jgi:hypothetical protein
VNETIDATITRTGSIQTAHELPLVAGGAITHVFVLIDGPEAVHAGVAR